MCSWRCKLLKAAYISLFDYDPIHQPGTFVGLKNYITMFKTQFYWEAWGNTFVFLALQIAMAFFIPIIQALFLNELRKAKNTVCFSMSCARRRTRFPPCICCRR